MEENAGRPKGGDSPSKVDENKASGENKTPNLAQQKITSVDVQTRIRNGLNSKDPGKQFEAQMAKYLLDNGVFIENFTQKYSTHEIDIELENFVIECKQTSSSINATRLIKQVNRIASQTGGSKKIIILTTGPIKFQQSSIQKLISELDNTSINYVLIEDYSTLLNIVK